MHPPVTIAELKLITRQKNPLAANRSNGKPKRREGADERRALLTESGARILVAAPATIETLAPQSTSCADYGGRNGSLDPRRELLSSREHVMTLRAKGRNGTTVQFHWVHSVVTNLGRERWSLAWCERGSTASSVVFRAVSCRMAVVRWSQRGGYRALVLVLGVAALNAFCGAQFHGPRCF